jgi:hypothetical protein
VVYKIHVSPKHQILSMSPFNWVLSAGLIYVECRHFTLCGYLSLSVNGARILILYEIEISRKQMGLWLWKALISAVVVSC